MTFSGRSLLLIGVWIKNAKEKCPDLVLVPYHYDLYMEKSRSFYDVLTAPQYGGKVILIAPDFVVWHGGSVLLLRTGARCELR